MTTCHDPETKLTCPSPTNGPAAEAEEMCGPVRRVLIMDDDKMIRDIMNEALLMMGYRTLAAECGHDAIESYQRSRMNNEPIDVVILDLHMPQKPDGTETLRKLLEIDPQVNVVVTSGDTSNPCITDFKGHGFKDALIKPFTIDALKNIVCSLAPLPG